MEDGSLTERTSGTPQGGVISPVLANLFLHYVFDDFMEKEFPTIPWARYADDGIAHRVSQKQAKHLERRLEKRFQEYRLELNQEKTRIVYCKDEDRKGHHENTSFDFLGYNFRPRHAKNRYGKFFINFLPAISGGGLYGRAIKLDYYQERIQRYKNLGYFIVMKQGPEIVGAEYASSDQLLLMRLHEIRYGIAASTIADILETNTFVQRRFADCIVGSAHLLYEGIMPNSSNTNGRTLKKYMAGLSYFGAFLETPSEVIPEIVDKYLKLEYGEQYVGSQNILNVLMLNLAIQQERSS